ncbi:metal-sulfur cluster assembly factor [Nocardia sp. SC052]|uniref:metal-sulfur cluster assembly factor n=1 Tax=Nocardia sichangensis TaxID=3385975 RepID=UPI0039A02B11
MSSVLQQQVVAALGTVKDPCSIATGRPTSIVDLGLVSLVEVNEEGDVQLILRATSPSCVLIGSILAAADERIAALPGVRSVRAEIDAIAVWTPEMMTPEGRQRLDSARSRDRADLMARRPTAATFRDALRQRGEHAS